MGCSSSATAHDIRPHLVIVGFQYAGFNLLQLVRDHFQITVIDKKDFFEWTTASPHSITTEGNFEKESVSYHKAVNVDKVFGKNVKFVQGILEELVDENTIKIKPTKGENSLSLISVPTKTISFDYLCLCTGHTWAINDAPEDAYKIFSSEQRSEFFSKHRKMIDQADSVLVVGGGPTGVELCGEILEKYGNKKRVGLATNDSKLASQYPEEIQEEAKKYLEEKGVEINLNTRYSSTSDLAKEYSLAVFCAGVKIMTPFMDRNYSDFKNSNGQILVNDHYQIKSGSKSIKNIFCFGDACLTKLNEPKNIPALDFAALIVSHNLITLTTSEELKKIGDFNFFISGLYFDHLKGALVMGDQVTWNPNYFDDKRQYIEPFFKILRGEKDGQEAYENYINMFRK